MTLSTATRRGGRALLGVSLGLVWFGCGSDSEGSGPASPVVGGMPTGGASPGTGSTISETGGDLTGTGATAATGGEGSSPLARCPAPRETLPHVGPWMSGPHPGPCTKTAGEVVTTYVYDAQGTLLRGELSDGRTETYERDLAGRISVVDDEVYRFEYDYSVPGVMTRTSSDLPPTYYVIDERRYPLSFSSDDLQGNYLYDDCRLVSIVAQSGAATLTWTTEYDTEGNFVRRSGDTGEFIFDYSCW